MYLRFFPTFSFIRFITSCLRWRSLIHLDLSFVQRDKNSSTTRTPVRLALFVEDAFFFPLYGFGSFVKNQVMTSVWIHFWVFNSIPLIYILSLYQYHEVFPHYFSVVQSEVRDDDFPQKFFYWLEFFSISWVLLFLQMKLRMVLSISVKNWIQILMGIALNL